MKHPAKTSELLGQLLLFVVHSQPVTAPEPAVGFIVTLNPAQICTESLCLSLHRQLSQTDAHINTNTHHTVTYCSVRLAAAARRRPWTLRMRWMSFLDGPSMLAASTNLGKITSRSFCSLFKLMTLKKRSVIYQEIKKNSYKHVMWFNVYSGCQVIFSFSVSSTPKRLMIVLGDMLPAHSLFFAAYVSFRWSFSQSK